MVSTLERWLHTVERDAEAVAIDDDGALVTRGELQQRVVNLASRLPVERGDVVALHLEHGTSFVAAVLACWWRGAGFVPVLPSLPAARKQTLVADAGAVAVIGGSLADLPTLAVEPGQPHSATAPVALRASDLAWVIHTSGSTGEPRGVAVTHAGLPALLTAQISAFDLQPGDRFLQVLSPAFDAAQSDLHTALCSGATLVFRPETNTLDGLRQALAHNITHVDLPPPLLTALSPRDRPASLRTVVVGGAPTRTDVIRAWADAVRLVCVYGPTEATICTHLRLADASWDRPWLGSPISGVQERIVNGELELAGPALARGYVNRPQETASAFHTEDGTRWYRTGDRVERVGDALVFLGRRDRQVKVGGHRVELGAIEAALRDHVTSVCAVLHSSGRLVAFVIGSAEQAEHAAAVLPTWMRPRVVTLDLMPVTASGKPDAGALHAWPLANAAPVGSPAEALLCSLWRDALGHEVAPTQDLIALGADSLHILDITVAAESAGWPIAPELWLTERTVQRVVASLATLDGSARASTLRARLEPIPTLSERPFPRTTPDHVLLTGATGWLGRHLLPELLRAGIRVEALVRGTSLVHAEQRLGLSHANLRVVLGDLALPHFAVSDTTWQRWTETLSGVIHSGARVHSVAPWSELAPTNLDGTRTALELCSTGNAKRLDLISTLSVFVATNRNTGVASEHDDLSATEQVYTGYAQTKWAAEVLCRSSHLPGLRIHRLGLLTGERSSGALGEHDFLARFLRGVVALGAIPEGLPHLELDISPVDDVVSALLRSLHAQPGTLHHAAPMPASLSHLLRALNHEGYRLRTVSADAFAARVAETRHPDASAAALALSRRLQPESFGRLRALDLFQTTGIRFDTKATQDLLGQPPVHAWSPELLQRYVRAALAVKP